VQLHLTGDRLFDTRTASAHKIAKLGTIDQCFRYPELYALLFFLRASKVKVFTYRGEKEKRELRWTRSNENEDFDRECWTI
jgi:hypothetical protein